MKGSKLLMLLISSGLVIVSIFLSKNDIWITDLYYSLSIFSLIIVIDFLFYELYCPAINGSEHLIFCVFPLNRLNILVLEIGNYLKRWEILLFLFSILFYISYFYFYNNSKILPLLLILFLYIVQFLYLVFSIFIIKNLLNKKYFKIKIKNLTSLYISFTVILIILSDKNDIAQLIFYLNPLSSVWLSFFVGEHLIMYAFITIIFFTLLLGLIINKKFKEWPLY